MRGHFRRTLSDSLRSPRAVLGLGLLLAGPAAAVTLPQSVAPHSIANWMAGQGLPENTVTAVLQTADGYLWVGTESGLARFDGLRFTTFRTATAPAFASHAVRALHEDRAQVLWIGTDAGLVRRAGGRFEPAGLDGLAVVSLAEDAGGALWAATSGGVFVRRGDRFEPGPRPVGPAGTRPRALFADREGRLWIAFAGLAGAARIEAGRMVRFDAGGALGAEVLSCAQTPDGALWFGTTDGLLRWQAGQAQVFKVADGLAGSRVTCLHVDAAGVLWVGSSGLQRITGGEVSSITAVAPAGATGVNSLTHDSEGNIWMGSADEGLLRVRQPAWQLIGLGARNTDTGVRSVMQGADGTLWLAQGSRGLVRVQAGGEVVRQPPASAAEADEVLSTYALPGGELFVATRGALRVMRAGGEDVHPELPEARAFFLARDGTLWIGVRNRGIHTWKDGRLQAVPLPGPVANCTPASFAEAADGTVLAGTWAHGLIAIGAGGITVWNRATGAPADDVRVVHVDRHGTTWVGVAGFGLALFEEGRLWTNDWSAQLLDERIDSLAEDAAGNLWIGTARGVVRAPREALLEAVRADGIPMRLPLVYVTEGLRGTIEDLSCFPNVCRTRTGQLCDATRNGLLLCDPARVTPNPRPPAVHIERVFVGDQPHHPATPLVLPAGGGGLIIEYTGISFTGSGRMRFRHRLVGVDPDWVDAGERRAASYASLPPGRHEFRVIAANADGVWNETGATLRFEQRARLHRQPWFYPLLAAGLAGGIAALARWRLALLERDKRRLEAAIADRTAELRAAKDAAEASTRAKSEFLQSLSHEIRNPLNGVIGLAGMLREGGAGARQDELLAALRGCSKSLARVFDDVLRFTRLEHGQLALAESPFAVGALVEELTAMFRVTGRAGGLAAEIEPGVPDRLIGDEEKIRTILGNFLANALRHAPGAPVALTVSADATNDYAAALTFTVTDAGPGIPCDEQELIFGKFMRGAAAREGRVPGNGLGLAMCRGLAELMGGHVGVDSEPGRGASFFLTVRLRRDRTVTGAKPAAGPAPPRRALVVEDQAYNQIVVRRIAERLGYEVEVASDGRGALARLARGPLDLILLDWELPDTTGEEVARAVRARPGGRDAILLATTAHDGTDLRRRAVAAGCDDLALKPLSTAAVARQVEDSRRRRRAAAVNGRLGLDTRVFQLVGRARPEGVRQAAEEYVAILRRELATLDGERRRQDRAAAARTAHRLKAHAGLVQAEALREAAVRLERAARQPGTDLGEPAAAVAAAAERVVRQLTRPAHPGAAA